MVALRGVRGDGDFRLLDAVTGETFDVVAADQLRSGIEISLPERFSARVLLIEPADQTEETATSLRYVGDTEAKGATVDLAAILTDAQGAPVEGRTVTFSLLGRVLVASTDASGRAAVIATIEDHGRTGEVTTSFAGDAVYGPSDE